MTADPRLTDADRQALGRAIELALAAEAQGNLPIGAVITLDGEEIAAAGSGLLVPVYHPGRHAETRALAAVPAELWPRAGELTCYTTLEPCVMCLGALLLHGVGRVVFGARDPLGGGGELFGHLPPYFAARQRRLPRWQGPALAAECDPLYRRAVARLAAAGKLGEEDVASAGVT